jgi:hypothetical protein
MPSPETFDAIAALLTSVMVAEAAGGFPRLSLCPSSETIKFLDYMATLAAPERDALFVTLGRVRAGHFYTFIPAVNERTRELIETDPAFRRYRAAMQAQEYTVGLRYVGLRMAKAMLNDPESLQMMARTRAGLPFKPRDDLPPALVPVPGFALVQPAKAPLLRKLIDPAFKRLFATEKTKKPGGEIVHSGVFEGTPINVGIDYAARTYQLRYNLHVPDETKTIVTRHLSYEVLFAASQGWDDLTEENAERSVALLCDLVARLARLRQAVFDLARGDG